MAMTTWQEHLRNEFRWLRVRKEETAEPAGYLSSLDFVLTDESEVSLLGDFATALKLRCLIVVLSNYEPAALDDLAEWCLCLCETLEVEFWLEMSRLGLAPASLPPDFRCGSQAAGDVLWFPIIPGGIQLITNSADGRRVPKADMSNPETVLTADASFDGGVWVTMSHLAMREVAYPFIRNYLEGQIKRVYMVAGYIPRALPKASITNVSLSTMPSYEVSILSDSRMVRLAGVTFCSWYQEECLRQRLDMLKAGLTPFSHHGELIDEDKLPDIENIGAVLASLPACGQKMLTQIEEVYHHAKYRHRLYIRSLFGGRVSRRSLLEIHDTVNIDKENATAPERVTMTSTIGCHRVATDLKLCPYEGDFGAIKKCQAAMPFSDSGLYPSPVRFIFDAENKLLVQKQLTVDFTTAFPELEEDAD